MRFKRQKEQKVLTFHKYFKNLSVKERKLLEQVVRRAKLETTGNMEQTRSKLRAKGRGIVSKATGRHHNWKHLELHRVRLFEKYFFCSRRYDCDNPFLILAWFLKKGRIMQSICVSVIPSSNI